MSRFAKDVLPIVRSLRVEIYPRSLVSRGKRLGFVAGRHIRDVYVRGRRQATLDFGSGCGDSTMLVRGCEFIVAVGGCEFVVCLGGYDSVVSVEGHCWLVSSAGVGL